VAIIVLGAIVGVLFWKWRNQPMVAENNGKSRDNFQGDETSWSNLVHDDVGAVGARTPAVVVFHSATIDMQDTNDVYVLEKSDVKVGFSFFVLLNGRQVQVLNFHNVNQL
jgi:hypothetical protein